jgi:putative transposase
MQPGTITLRFRLRDTADSELRRQARAVNFVWNFCNETQRHALKWDKKWPSGFDLVNLTSGSSKELDIASESISQTCLIYERSRRISKRQKLRWRGAKSLGWVPFGTRSVTYSDGAFVFRGRRYQAWVSRDLPEGLKLRSGSFSQDSRGRWYISFSAAAPALAKAPADAVGVDLGLKDLAALSTGATVPAPRWYRKSQQALAVAQRANKARRVAAIAARVKNQRMDHLHKLSAALTAQHGTIFVGDVSASRLSKTSAAKSVLDAGWSMLKTQLAYKASRRQGVYGEVDESYSTQTCNECGVIAGPKGRAGLNKRVWQCACGAVHDRDVNAARNILRRGLATLAEGAPSTGSGQTARLVHALQDKP